ncbi:MAG: hypothetical protein LQ337_001544 [Flavoplaca oasis]|nr:MAG: hypothetical protein LQ337_001544 [Flavoplaca oasis]
MSDIQRVPPNGNSRKNSSQASSNGSRSSRNRTSQQSNVPKKFSAEDDDLQEILALQFQIFEKVAALVQARQSQILQGVRSDSPIQSGRQLPAVNEATLNTTDRTSGFSASSHDEIPKWANVKLYPFPRSQIRTPDLLLHEYFCAYGNDERHQHDAAGIIASYLFARDNRLLGKDEMHHLLGPVYIAVNEDRRPEMWYKFLRRYYDDKDKNGKDKLLKTHVMGPTQRLQEWDIIQMNQDPEFGKRLGELFQRFHARGRE